MGPPEISLPVSSGIPPAYSSNWLTGVPIRTFRLPFWSGRPVTVPFRFMESSLPGYQVTVRPFIWNVTIRLSGFLSDSLKTLPSL